MSGARPPLHLVILAGGGGTRARTDAAAQPKQFADAAGRPLVAWSARTLAAHPATVSLTVTCAADWRDAVAAALPGSPAPHFAEPGPTRTASTWSALETLRAGASPDGDDLVAIHDAARPFASLDLLTRLHAAARDAGGAVPGLPVADTVVRREDDGSVTYLRRDLLHAVQTPQVFRWAPLHAAHAWAAAEGRGYTDDGGLLAARAAPPVVVAGEPGNWKVTTADDLERACARLEAAR